MEIISVNNEEIDLTLDDDSQSDVCEEPSGSEIDVEKEEIKDKKEESPKNNNTNMEIQIHIEDVNLASNRNEEVEAEISKLIKHEEKLKNGEFVHIFSSGPIQKDENETFRPINCHACLYTTNSLNEMKLHIQNQEHLSKILNYLPERRHQGIYNLFDKSPKEFKIMICLFGGENIPEVHEENKNRLVYFCTATNKLKLQKIVLNRTNKDILNEINKAKPLMGLEYCIKFSNNYSYYCVLCTEQILKDPLIHFNSKQHLNNYIVRHFLQTRNAIVTTLRDDEFLSKANEIVEEVILEIYKTLEKKYHLRKINSIEQKMFNCFRNHIINIVCNNFHYNDERISNSEIRKVTKECILKFKKIKNEQLNLDQNIEDEPVVINDENDNSELIKNTQKNTQYLIDDENSSEIVSIIPKKNCNKNENLQLQLNFELCEESSETLSAEEDFEKLQIISDLDVSNFTIAVGEASTYWGRTTFSLEYFVRYRYFENGKDMFKFKCTLCNKYLKNLYVPHSTSRIHRMKYIDKHFPILKRYLKGYLVQMNFDSVEEDIIIGQMIAEICQRLKKATKTYINQFYRVNIKKFTKNKLINSKITKLCSNRKHYDDKYFITVYKNKVERQTFIKDHVKRILIFYNNDIISKRKNVEESDEEKINKKKPKTNYELENTPITLISVLKLIEDSPDLLEVNTETRRLLKHAEEMENVNGNITELMKSIEYLNFFKKIMNMLKDMVESNNIELTNEKERSINRILDNSTLLVESMEEGIELNEPPVSEVLTIDDDDEPEFISSTDANDNLKKLPNPFNSKFKNPNSKAATRNNQQNSYQANFSSNRNNVNNEIRVNNRNIGQSYMNISRPNSSVLNVNANVNRYNSNPVLNVTTYRETTQMNMSIPILGNSVNNQNPFRNVFSNNQQNHHQRFQNTSLAQQQINFSKAFSTYASRATRIQQSSHTAPQPPPAPIPQQTVRSLLPTRTLPIVLTNASPQSSGTTAQNQIFNPRLNYRPAVAAPPPPNFQHVSISNFNNLHGNTLSINQRFQTIRSPFSLNNSFPRAYGSTRNLFVGRTNF